MGKDRKLTGDYNGKEYLAHIRENDSDEAYIHGTNMLLDGLGSDNGFYGHLKSGSIKSSKKVKGCCE